MLISTSSFQAFAEETEAVTEVAEIFEQTKTEIEEIVVSDDNTVQKTQPEAFEAETVNDNINEINTISSVT